MSLVECVCGRWNFTADDCDNPECPRYSGQQDTTFECFGCGQETDPKDAVAGEPLCKECGGGVPMTDAELESEYPNKEASVKVTRLICEEREMRETRSANEVWAEQRLDKARAQLRASFGGVADKASPDHELVLSCIDFLAAIRGRELAECARLRESMMKAKYQWIQAECARRLNDADPTTKTDPALLFELEPLKEGESHRDMLLRVFDREREVQSQADVSPDLIDAATFDALCF